MKSVFMAEVPYFSDPISVTLPIRLTLCGDMLMCKMPKLETNLG